MSRVYFHSPSGTAELMGSERAWLAGHCDHITEGLLNLRHSQDRLRSLISSGHYLAKHPQRDRTGMPWGTAFELSFSMGGFRDEPLIAFEGHAIDTFQLTLNTACLVGNDQIKLAARVHGQCEIHAWVDGPNRAWLADIMEGGLDSGLYRRKLIREASSLDPALCVDQGWEDVIALLRAGDDEPVVTSYSVTDNFPNSSVGDWMPAMPADVPDTPAGWNLLTPAQRKERLRRMEAWYELDSAEQWRIAMAGLRESRGSLELRPDEWAQYRFGHSLTVLDLLAPDYDQRIRAALGIGLARSDDQREGGAGR